MLVQYFGIILVVLFLSNRAAAHRCRAKKREWVKNLEKKAEDLQATNTRLQVRKTVKYSSVGVGGVGGGGGGGWWCVNPLDNFKYCENVNQFYC